MNILIIYYYYSLFNVASGRVYCSTIRKEAIDRGNEFGALLTDLSEAFDRINHPLLIAKLYNYGVSLLSINMIFS